MTISVVIADDQALVRGGFVLMVNGAPDMTVLGEAQNGAEAVALARQHDVLPVALVLDVSEKICIERKIGRAHV